MFYLFFPPICWLLGRGKWLVAFLLVFVVLGPIDRAVFAQGNEVWQEYSYLGGMDAVAFGCLTAIAKSRNVPTPPRPPGCWVVWVQCWLYSS